MDSFAPFEIDTSRPEVDELAERWECKPQERHQFSSTVMICMLTPRIRQVTTRRGWRRSVVGETIVWDGVMTNSNWRLGVQGIGYASRHEALHHLSEKFYDKWGPDPSYKPDGKWKRVLSPEEQSIRDAVKQEMEGLA